MDILPPPEFGTFNIPRDQLSPEVELLIEQVRQLKAWCHELYKYLEYQSRIEVEYIEMKELTSDPAAPGANRVRVYAVDNGSSKTKLSARFNTGAVQSVAVEP